jgi:hypothetical protein
VCLPFRISRKSAHSFVGYVERLYNNRADDLKSVIQLITQWKCYHPQSDPLPEPYSAPCEFSSVGNNAAGPFLIASSLPPSLLPSLHLRARNGFLLMQAWSLEIKKSGTGLGQVIGVDVPTRGSCASPETSCQTVRCVPASYPNLLIVDLVNGLTFRHPINANNP